MPGKSISDDHRSNIDVCKSIFPSWVWIIGLTTGISAAIIALSWSVSAQTSEFKNEQIRQDSDINKLQTEVSKVDTVLYILRGIASRGVD